MSAGNAGPIQVQPNGSTSYPSRFSKPTAVVPPGLECLVEVEEIILQNKVFQTKNEQTLFTVRRESECCGPAFNLQLRDPYRRDVVSLYLVSNGTCCGGDTYLRVSAIPGRCIGVVIIVKSSGKLNVSIQMGNREPLFSAQMPIDMHTKSSSTIQICTVDGSYPVAHIRKEKEGKSSQVIFHFPMDMEASLKAVILAAFLYMGYQASTSYTSNDSDIGWATAGGVDFTDMHHNHHGDDWGGGGDCGCGDWGGGGGDCGGGGGGDCGGGGGDCGGGGCE